MANESPKTTTQEKVLQDVRQHMNKIKKSQQLSTTQDQLAQPKEIRTVNTQNFDNKLHTSLDVTMDCESNISPYLEVIINNMDIISLLDTGSTHTIMAREYAEKMGFLRLDTYQQHQLLSPKAANGNHIQTYGHLSIPISIGSARQCANIIIADIEENLIIGMDIITQMEFEILFARMVIKIHDEVIPLLNRKGKRLSSRCLLKEDVIIPAMSEINLPLMKQHKTADQEGLIEPITHHQIFDQGLLMSRCVVNNTSLYIRVANLNEQPLKLEKHQAICNFTSRSWLEYGQPDVQTEIPAKNYHIATDHSELPGYLEPLYNTIPEHISQESREKIRQLLIKYSDVFSKGAYDLGKTQLIQHEIKLKEGTEPTKIPPYRVGHHGNVEIEKHVQELLDKKLIEPSNSPYSSPLILVKKKDGTKRVCIDYRTLNKNTVMDAYPLPRIEDNLDALGGSKYFSVFDLVSGFHQVPLSDDAKDKTAFCTQSGLYSWVSMPMGLTNSPATFSKLMEIAMKGLTRQSLMIYLDDIIVFSQTEVQHIERLTQVFERLREANLKIKVNKSSLFQKQVKYLGHVISAEGISTDPDKIKAIQNIKTPVNTKDIKSLLGMAGYYRKFIQDYATIVQPLTRLLKKKVPYLWTEECAKSLNTLKSAMISSDILMYPDFMKEFILDTDCSGIAMGAVLSQLNEQEEEKPIAYFSRSLKMLNVIIPSINKKCVHWLNLYVTSNLTCTDQNSRAE